MSLCRIRSRALLERSVKVSYKQVLLLQTSRKEWKLVHVFDTLQIIAPMIEMETESEKALIYVQRDIRRPHDEFTVHSDEILEENVGAKVERGIVQFQIAKIMLGRAQTQAGFKF